VTGNYKTSDDTTYEVFWGKFSGKDALMAQCVSSLTKNGAPFPLSEENLLKNLKYNLWKKIE